MKNAARAKAHYHSAGSDFTQCGLSGPEIVIAKGADAVTCRNCLRDLRKRDGAWHLALRWEIYENCNHDVLVDRCDCPELQRRKKPTWMRLP